MRKIARVHAARVHAVSLAEQEKWIRDRNSKIANKKTIQTRFDLNDGRRKTNQKLATVNATHCNRNICHLKREQPPSFQIRDASPRLAVRIFFQGSRKSATIHVSSGVICRIPDGPIFDGPRGNLGAVNADYDYFANLVYNHTTALPQHRALLGNNNPNLDMGNYSRARLSGGTLRQIYFWARDEIGFRPPLQGRLGKGEAGPSGVTYTLNVTNGGLQGKGMIAEGITVSLNIPADTTVVAATGTGYQGLRTDEKSKASVAVWQLPRSAPKDQERITITLSKAAIAADDLKGTIRWAKLAPKTGPSQDEVVIAPAPL